MKRFMLLSMMVLVAFLITILYLSIQARAAEVKESVLVVVGPAGYFSVNKIDPEFRAKMTEAGIALDQTTIEKATPERMKRYNVVLFYGVPSYNDRKGTAALEAFIPNLDAYLDAGGSFLYLDNSYGGYAPGANILMERFGIHFTEQPVFDDTITFTDPDTGNQKLISTTKITEHPVTQGIDKIIFPTWWHNSAGFIPDDNWDVLITGEDTTKTKVIYEVWGRNQHTYESNPPLLAVRRYDEGRMAVFPTNYVYTIQDAYGSAKGVVAEKGNTTKLLVNLFDWLAAPSIASGAVGGFDGSTFEEIPQPATYNPVPVEDQRVEKNVYKGIIGAHSTYSGYPNTVKELCDKAKQLGLDYLAFTEDFEKCDPAQWDDYIEEIEAQKTDSFIALAGYEYEAIDGTKWIGVDFMGDLNKRVMMTEDRKLKEVSSPLWLGWPVIAPINMSTLPEKLQPSWSSLKFYTATPLKVYDVTKVIDDSEDKYLYTINNKYWSRPITVHMCYSASDLEQAAASDTYKTYALAPNIDVLFEAFHRKMTDYPNGNAVFVSNGPQINEFVMVGEGWTLDPWEYYYLYRPGDTAKMYIDVASDAGLAEVLVMASGMVRRRFLPDGKTFKTDFDWVFTDDSVPYLIVKDAEGKTAISYNMMVKMDVFWASMCADLQNTLAGGMFGPVEKGGLFFRGEYRTFWGGALATVIGTNGARLDPVVVPEDAGGILSESHSLFTEVRVGFNDSPIVRTKDKTISLTASPIDFVFADAEIHKLRNNYTAHWNEGASDTIETESYISAFPVRKNEYNYMLIEQRLRFKKDTVLAEDGTLQIKMLSWHPDPANFPNFTIMSADGDTVTQVRKENPTFTGTLDTIGYASFWPQVSGSCGLFVLDDNIYDVQIDNSGITVGFTLPGKEIKKGTEFATKLLLIRDNGTFDGDAGITAYGNAYGITDPIAYTPDVEKGDATNFRFTCDGAADDGVFAMNLTDNTLPTQLVTTVSGVSDKLPCYYYNRTTGDMRLLGVHDGTAILTEKFDPEAEVVIGNAVECDDDEVIVDITEYSHQAVTLSIHNPTDKDTSIEIATQEDFDFLPDVEAEVAIPAGSSTTITLRED